MEQKLHWNFSSKFSGPSTVTWVCSFLPALDLHLSPDWHLCRGECLPTTGQSFLNSLLQALEETSLIGFTGDTYSFGGEPLLSGHVSGSGGDLIS